MVRIAWIRDLSCDVLMPVEIFEHKLKIGDYIRDVSFIDRHKNDYGKNYCPYEDDNMVHGPFRVEMVKGFDNKDFESFSYYCNIINNWKGIKHFFLVRESYSNVLLANYLDICDLTSDYCNVQYTDWWGKTYPNYTAFSNFINSEEKKIKGNKGDDTPAEVKKNDMIKHQYILAKFADRWGNFTSNKTYLYELNGNINSKIHIGSIINITKLCKDSYNIMDNPYDKKQLRVERIMDLTPEEANKRIEISTFDSVCIYTIYGVDVIKETFTDEELGIISWSNIGEGFEIWENNSTSYGCAVKNFEELENYMKTRKDCEKQMESEAIHITDFKPVEIDVVKDSSDIISNADYITSITSGENSASKKKQSFVEEELQNSKETFVDRIERCIADKDYLVYPGNQNGFSDELKEQFVYIDPCTMEPYPDNTTIKKGDAYLRYSRTKTPIIKTDNNKKERKTMKNIFKNFSFGELKTKEIAYSFNGIAFRDSSMNYCVYNVDTNEATNVSDLVIDVPLYTIPVNRDTIKKGDIIKHKSNFFIVKAITTNGIEAIEPMGGVIMTLIPERSIFGFNYYTKVITPFSMIGNTANEANPFGNMLPFIFMNKDNDSDNSDMFKYLMMFSFMGNGNSNINQMLPFMLMSEDKETNPMLMMMLAQNFNSYNAPMPIEDKGEDVEELKKNIAEIKTIIEQINNKRDIAEIKTSIKQINDMINEA